MTQEPISDPTRLAQRVMASVNSLSDEEASQRYQQILSQLPRDEAARLNALALTQVAPDQRRVLASGLKQAHQDPNSAFDGYDDDDDDEAATPQRLGQLSARAAQQDPGVVNNLFGGENSGLGGQVGKAALAALAALLLRKFLSGQGEQTAGGPAMGSPGAMDPVTMILGGLLGSGALGGGAPQGGAYGGQAGGAGDLGSILGGLLGGGAMGNQVPQGGSYGGGQAGGPDLGSILGSVLGEVTRSQGGARGDQAGGPDLGSILGSILGGGGASHRKD